MAWYRFFLAYATGFLSRIPRLASSRPALYFATVFSPTTTVSATLSSTLPAPYVT
jgi:hypothetical protein